MQSGSSSIVIPPFAKVLHISLEICDQMGIKQWGICPFISSGGVQPCPHGTNCNFDHNTNTRCARPTNFPTLPECPSGVSFSRSSHGPPIMTFYENCCDEKVGTNSYLHGVEINDDDTNKWYENCTAGAVVEGRV